MKSTLLTKLIATCWLALFFILALIWSVIQLPLSIISTGCALFGSGKVKQYGLNCLIGKDNMFSAQTGGDPDETISSRLGKARKRGSGWGKVANKVDLVAKELFNDHNHCNNSIEADEGKDQVTRY